MRYCLLLILLLSPFASASPLRVAVASNFHDTLETLAGQFSRTHGIAVELVPGASGTLYAQILHGAPFDLFFSADRVRPQQLVTHDAAIPGSLTVYAVGRLALWQPRGQHALTAGSRVALANPTLAPYGAAAQAWLLQHAGEAQAVFGNNVAQAFHFVASGNADTGLVALAQVLSLPANQRGHVRELDTPEGASLQQAAVITRQSRQPDVAARFLAHLGTAKAQATLQARGYHLPPAERTDEPR